MSRPQPISPLAGKIAGRPERDVTALALVAASVFAIAASPAHAACPIELATYRDGEGKASLEFRPAEPAAAVTNSFRLIADGVVFDGLVMWTDEVRRPVGMLSFRCPEGDATGAEIEACTLWQGVVYAVDERGQVSLLPAEGTAAPPRLILADLAYAMRFSTAWKTTGLAAAPGDVFELSGCQE